MASGEVEASVLPPRNKNMKSLIGCPFFIARFGVSNLKTFGPGAGRHSLLDVTSFEYDVIDWFDDRARGLFATDCFEAGVECLVVKA